jgi:hypothetical protein
VDNNYLAFLVSDVSKEQGGKPPWLPLKFKFSDILALGLCLCYLLTRISTI